MTTIPWAYPLKENEDQNRHNLHMYVIEKSVQDLDYAEKKLARAIKSMQDYESSYYKGRLDE